MIVERYLKILLALEPRLEELERVVLTSGDDEVLAELIGYKSNLTRLRRFFHYHLDLANDLRQHETPGIGTDLDHEINDLYEQQERATSLADLYYQLAADLIDGYISVSSHRLNQIMRILTIITAIFVPLSFLAGIYGMNFENMPELKSRWGYYLLLGTMATLVTAMLYFFRRKRWL
jgi:magnesium transporter